MPGGFSLDLLMHPSAHMDKHGGHDFPGVGDRIIWDLKRAG